MHARWRATARVRLNVRSLVVRLSESLRGQFCLSLNGQFFRETLLMSVCVTPASTQFCIPVQLVRHVLNLLLLAALLVGSGCSGASDGPVRFPISGAVTFDGKPVLDGEIFLQPDEKAGNSGPATIAGIRDSKYSVPLEQGIVGGPYLVKITAYEVPKGAAGPLAFRGGPLFPDYATKVDFPKKQTTHDFDVPAKK